MPTNETVTPTADLTETEVSKPAPEETETDAEPITFEDILSDPEFKAAYDRKVNQV